MTTTALIIRRLRASERLPPVWRGRARLAINLLTGLTRRFPGHADRRVCLGFVPGRIEVLGRHTDYAGGRSLVCAIDRGFLFAATAGAPGRVRMMVEDRAEFEPLDFSLDPSLSPRLGDWANYPVTMARRLSANFGREKPLTGMDVVFSSTLPVGSGMSGSSALMMMTFTALAEVNDLADMPVFRRAIRNPMDLAVYLACAENGQGFRDLAGDRGVGTFGGSEDHAAILNARAGFVSLFGDYTKGIARIQCTNASCRAEYFRPFSCKVFHLCPSCSQKRTLLFGEYMNEQLLLQLPHRQFVFTLPKVLRMFFRHDRRLHGEISRLIFRLVRDFASAAAGRRIRTAALVVFQSSGEFLHGNPHWHALFLEGGFDRQGRFVHIPTVDLAKMSACFRQRVIAFFLQRRHRPRLRAHCVPPPARAGRGSSAAPRLAQPCRDDDGRVKHPPSAPSVRLVCGRDFSYDQRIQRRLT